MKKLFILIITALVVLTGCSKVHKERCDMSTYEKLSDTNHVFETISLEDAYTLIKEGTGVLYVGKPDCSHCQNLVPTLNEVAKENGVETIYYLDVTDYDTQKEEFDKVISLFKALYDGDPKVPTVLAVKDGIIIGFNYTDEITKEDLSKLVASLKESASLVINDYYKPVITLKEGYEDMLTYVAGEKFDIEDFVELDFYQGKKGLVWFELADKDDDYTQTGIHDILIVATDLFGGSSTLETKLLTEREEVINLLSLDDKKPTLSAYATYVENVKKENSVQNSSGLDSTGSAGLSGNTTTTKTSSSNSSTKTTTTTTASSGDDTANYIVNSSEYYGYGCEAIAGVYHGLGGNEILYQGVSQVSSPQKGDLIAYFDGSGNYKHTATYLGNGLALHGNWSNGKAAIATENIYSSRVYFRLGGDTPYINAINNTAHSKGGKAGWLEGYTVGGSSSNTQTTLTEEERKQAQQEADARITTEESPGWDEYINAAIHGETYGDCSIYEGNDNAMAGCLSGLPWYGVPEGELPEGY